MRCVPARPWVTDAWEGLVPVHCAVTEILAVQAAKWSLNKRRQPNRLTWRNRVLRDGHLCAAITLSCAGANCIPGGSALWEKMKDVYDATPAEKTDKAADWLNAPANWLKHSGGGTNGAEDFIDRRRPSLMFGAALPHNTPKSAEQIN